MKLIDTLNEILNEADRGGINGTGIGAGRVGAKIGGILNTITPGFMKKVSGRKGLAGAYQSTEKAETALQNVGFGKTIIGKSGVKGEDRGVLKYSILDNLVSRIGIYQQVNQSVLNTIKNIINSSNGDDKTTGSLYSINVKMIDPNNLFYKVNNSDVYYWGKSNTSSKFYVPKNINNNNLVSLKPEDITMMTNYNLNPADYKLYEYRLVIRK